MSEPTANNGYRINVKGKADFNIKVDGKKFNPRKDYVAKGEHTIEVTNKLYLTEWYGIFMVILDFLFGILASEFGEMFVKQGYVRYNARVVGLIDSDVLLDFDGEKLELVGCDSLCVESESREEYPRLKKVLKKYGLICRIVLLVLFAAMIIAIIALYAVLHK
ncbi:MAG: hypothetical protein K2M44_06715 [Clostridia bacterium]|nr:hypothetical protein [Clostridia bacterium]